jgi:transcriptional regulator with XRE-family HTH domain
MVRVSNPEPNVGSRIRSLREQQGLSLRALADRCGLSINAISQIERGENSPTVASLHRIASALNISTAEMFQEESRQRVVFIRRDMGLKAKRNGIVMENLGIGLADQQIVPYLVTLEPGSELVEDEISHHGEEFVHCLIGQVEYTVEGKAFSLERGDSLLFDSRQAHRFHNPSSTPASLLLVFHTHQDRHSVQQLHL